jgi:hypothetical protein
MTRLLMVVLVSSEVLLSGCGMLWQKKERSESIRSDVNPSNLQTIAVVAGGDDRNAIRMSATVRQDLTNAGITALRRSGRWATEIDAVNGICPLGEAVTVDGVLFVYYDHLLLMDCRTHKRAYEIAGGDSDGLPGMTKRLVAYLQTSSKTVADSARTQD